MENRYDKYKDSGIAWIGEIPEHWEIKRLKNVCSTNNASLSDQTSKEFEFNYVDIGSVSFELGIHKTEKYTFQNAPSRARKIARLGDIIVSTVRTYLRAIDIINSGEKEKYIYSTGFAILSPLKNILSEFMIYICRSEYFTNQVSIYSTGINYPSINDTALKMINIVMPTLSEQQTIAAYLDQKCGEIDELITLQEEMITKLQSYKQSVITEAVTKGLDKNVLLKDSGIEWIGEIPKHWTLKRIKNICDNLDYLREPISAEHRSRNNPIYDYYGASGVIDKIDFYNVDDQVLLIGEDGANLVMRNLPLVYKANGKFWVNNHAHILKPKNDNYDFCAYAFEAADYSLFITGSAQPKLSQENLGRIKIAIPPFLEQQAIVNYLDKKCSEIDKLISIKQQKIEKLKEYKKSLIFECVTGKRKVS